MFTVFYFIVFLATHCILFIVFLHVVRYCMQYSSFFYGVLFFLLIFCHYFSVTVVSFFAVVCEWCEQCGSCAFLELCGWGGELQSCFEVLVFVVLSIFCVCFP